jgi:CheY-like chemotaxis protein
MPELALPTSVFPLICTRTKDPAPHVSVLNEYGKNFRYVLLDLLVTRKVFEYRHRVKNWTNRCDSAANRSVAPMNDPVIQAGKIWEQHCSWCQLCDRTIPRCELGRKAYDFYAFVLRIAASDGISRQRDRPTAQVPRLLGDPQDSGCRYASRATALKSPRARLLIADDEASVREVLRHFLTREGYLVSTVADGREALDAVPTFQPEVILVDMVMPGLSGIDVLAALRRAGVTVPVVLISGQIIVREGFFGVLTKPFELRRLAEVVAAAVDHGRTSGA